MVSFMSITGAKAPMKLLRHIRIRSGALQLDYNAPAEQAANIAAELGRMAFEVVVDDSVDDVYPLLPCSALWE